MCQETNLEIFCVQESGGRGEFGVREACVGAKFLWKLRSAQNLSYKGPIPVPEGVPPGRYWGRCWSQVESSISMKEI